MGKKIISFKINSYGDSQFIKIYNIYCYIIKKIHYKVKYSVYDENKEFIENLKILGFNKIPVFKKESLDFSDEKVKEQRLDKTRDYFVLEKDLIKSEIQEYFEFSISIQISGKEIKRFYPLTKELKVIDNDIITFISHADNTDGTYGKFGATADKLFGPRYKTESWYRTEDERASEEYRKHISEIEKIFLTKEFRDVEVIGTENEFVKNGKIERLELDLRNPDMAVYEKMRAIDNCIEIEWEE